MIPKRISILGVPYKIVIVDEFIDSGGIDFIERVITIEKDTEEEMIGVLLHECIHGVFYEGETTDTFVHEQIEEITINQTVKFLMEHFTVSPK